MRRGGSKGKGESGNHSEEESRTQWYERSIFSKESRLKQGSRAKFPTDLLFRLSREDINTPALQELLHTPIVAPRADGVANAGNVLLAVFAKHSATNEVASKAEGLALHAALPPDVLRQLYVVDTLGHDSFQIRPLFFSPNAFSFFFSKPLGEVFQSRRL